MNASRPGNITSNIYFEMETLSCSSWGWAVSVFQTYLNPTPPSNFSDLLSRVNSFGGDF